jgi:hypothetical protein
MCHFLARFAIAGDWMMSWTSVGLSAPLGNSACTWQAEVFGAIVRCVLQQFCPTDFRCVSDNSKYTRSENKHSLLLIRIEGLPERLPRIEELFQFSPSLSQIVGAATQEFNRVDILLPRKIDESCDSFLPAG